MATEQAGSRRRDRNRDGGRTLLEREAELGRLTQLLAGAREGDGAVAFIEAPAGRGKSQLLAAAGEIARDAGMRVLEGRGGELERDFPFGLALQLFEPAWFAADAGARASLLEGPAHLAGELMTGLAADAGPLPEDRSYSLIHGLFWLASNLTTAPNGEIDGRPVAMIVDDVHWADWPSLRFLAYLAERIPGLPIALVVAARDGEPTSDRRALAALRDAARGCVLRPAPLSTVGVGVLVRETFPDADGAFMHACARVTDGNPFLLVELLEEVRGVGARPDARTATQVAELTPGSVLDMVVSRLAALPAEASALAYAVAVLDGGTPVKQAALVADLDVDTVLRAADALASIHLFHPGTPLGFVHPLVSSAVRASMTELRRSQIHRRAAAVLSAEGAAEEQIAAHLLAAPPESDPATVEVLRAAARKALAGGAPDSAVRMLERALGEGPQPEVYADLLAELGHAELAAGRPEAVQRIEDAINVTAERPRRAQLALSHGRALYGARRYEEAAGVLATALDALDEHDAELAEDLEAAYIAAATFVPALRQNARARGTAMLERIGDQPTAGQRVAITHIAIQSSLRGEERTSVVRLAELAWGEGALLDAETPDGIVWPLLAGSLLFIDELERNLEICDAAVLATGERNAPGAFAAASYCRTWSLYHQGRIAEALEEARASVDAGSEGWYDGGLSAYGAIAACHLQRGELELAERTLTVLDQPAAVEEIELPVLLDVRAQLRLAQMRPHDALSDAVEAGRRCRLGLGDVGPGVLAWRSTAALAYVALGELEDAIRLASEELELARRSGVTRVIIRGLRVLGVAERGKRRLDLLEEAVETGASYPPRLEYAHALVELGAALRRANQRSAAREPLRKGLELAHRGGSRMLVAQARRDLAATGARPRRAILSGPEALTPSERRVAELAVQGLTTRQISEALYVTPKTVEFHLRHIYRKLDVSSSRSELARALASE